MNRSGSKPRTTPASTRPAAAIAALAYLLIAFEFFYMASPFALYVYGVYGPGLRWLARTPGLDWMVQTFLPHAVVRTRSPIINGLPPAGALLFTIGGIVFLIAAADVYFRKLTRRGLATGLLYARVRHPQYAALMVSGLGLLILWPRFAALASFLLMLFVYRALAALEERECISRFGAEYVAYMQRTGRFVPRIRVSPRAPEDTSGPGIRPTGRWPSTVALWIGVIFLGFGSAYGLREWTLRSLSKIEEPNAIVIGVTTIDDSVLRDVASLARSDGRVRAKLVAAGDDGPFIDYILPASWSVPEIPMSRRGHGHYHPADYDPTLYRVVFTRVQTSRNPRGLEILRSAVVRTPVCEAVVDIRRGTVVEVTDPPRKIAYEGIPVPLI
jgi:protein-S-isoprenylcysteine O-methyltransferase Ste14